MWKCVYVYDMLKSRLVRQCSLNTDKWHTPLLLTWCPNLRSRHYCHDKILHSCHNGDRHNICTNNTHTDLFVHILRIFVFYYREFQYLYNLGLRQCRYISYASWNKFNIGWDTSANRGSQDGETYLREMVELHTGYENYNIENNRNIYWYSRNKFATAQ